MKSAILALKKAYLRSPGVLVVDLGDILLTPEGLRRGLSHYICEDQLLQKIQTRPVEVPHPPMPEGGGSRRLHCELRRAALTDKVERKKVQVVLKLLERKPEVVCLQPWIVFVEDGNDAVARPLLNREEVTP